METQEVTMDTRDSVSTKMEQIATNAKRLPDVSFTSLAYHIDLKWLYEAFKETRRDGAVGVDEVTAEEYEKELKGNLERLLEQMKSGRYKAPAVKRVYIPKEGTKEMRPLGITTFEDKILQKAVKWVIEPIYEQDFYDCSHGFRPNRSQHTALKELWKKMMNMGGGWIIDLDIRKFFDTIRWDKLREVIQRRVRDGVLIRLIGKWMNAGIMEEGELIYPESGVQQGGVISPILSNIFLHEILDEWLHEIVFPLMKGKAFEIRFADDALICFECKEDTERVLRVLPKRLKKYGLEMNEKKTKLIRFDKPKNNDEYKTGKRKGTFNFIGFTHYWKKSRNGNPVVARKTMKERLNRALMRTNEWCKENRHMKIVEQHKKLSGKLHGHYAYYGIVGNYRSMSCFIFHVIRIWHKWLNRRSRNRDLYWLKMYEILERYSLPRPRIVHSNV
jgi:RNA-directed DNA polymerase